MKNLWTLTKISACVLLSTGLVACGGSSGGALVTDKLVETDAPPTADTPELTDPADNISTSDTAESGDTPDATTTPDNTDSDNTDVTDAAADNTDATDAAADNSDVTDAVADNTDATGDTLNETSAPAPDVDPVPQIAREIDGSWTTGCFPFEGGGDSQSRVLTLVIEGDTSVFTAFSYSDLNCSVPATPIDGVIATESSNTDSLEFPDQTVSTSLGEASFINFTTESFTNDGVTEPGSGTVFSIFIIDDDRLFFGAGASTTPENRPLTLDLFFFYTRS